MIAVIQCAGKKRSDAGTLQCSDGRPVKFVGRPDLAPNDQNFYSSPDSPTDEGITWREKLIKYNQKGDNPLGLSPAYRLYDRAIYQRLANHVGLDRLFILSAGWGIIRADFFTPAYDITFSNSARGEKAYQKRKKSDQYCDFNFLPHTSSEPIIFFGGQDYLPLFLHLTGGTNNPRYVTLRSKNELDVPGYVPLRYETTRKTNWHYSCAEDFIRGTFRVP